MKQHEKFTAVYCRTARPDDFSILTQKDLFTQLANDRGYGNLKYYQDNGYSGLSFERPAFLQMCKDIQDGNIQRILIVGISRIGRNCRSMSRWLNEIALAGVSLISLKDQPCSELLTKIC